ncbi:MAG: GGDEF domain-containing protein [Octadecabacter sp.]
MVIAICAMRLMAGVLVAFAGGAAVPVFGATAGFLGTFGLQTALMLGAFSAAGLLRHGNGRWGAASLLVGLFCFVNMIVGCIFGVVPSGSDVGVFTLLGMGAGAAAMVSMHVHRPFVRVAFLIGDVGSQTRVMAAAVMAVPLGGGLVLDWTTSGGMTALEVGVLSIVSCSLLFVLFATSARHEGSVAMRRRAERDIAMRSRTDELTGALNRFGMTEVVEGAWLEFKRTGAGAQFGMILLDLDYFRRLDATFGHDDGEAVLGRVAQTVQSQLRGFDALGRWDKDEFMVLLKIKDYANIAIVADRIRHALASADSPFGAGLEMEPARMDIGLGMAGFMEGDETAAMAIIRADIALNEAKFTEAQMMTDLKADDPFDIFAEFEDEIEDTAAAA